MSIPVEIGLLVCAVVDGAAAVGGAGALAVGGGCAAGRGSPAAVPVRADAEGGRRCRRGPTLVSVGGGSWQESLGEEGAVVVGVDAGGQGAGQQAGGGGAGPGRRDAVDGGVGQGAVTGAVGDVGQQQGGAGDLLPGIQLAACGRRSWRGCSTTTAPGRCCGWPGNGSTPAATGSTSNRTGPTAANSGSPPATS